eukprot:4330181-Ditylum_brightwellii.AAC.2
MAGLISDLLLSTDTASIAKLYSLSKAEGATLGNGSDGGYSSDVSRHSFYCHALLSDKSRELAALVQFIAGESHHTTMGDIADTASIARLDPLTKAEGVAV